MKCMKRLLFTLLILMFLSVSFATAVSQASYAAYLTYYNDAKKDYQTIRDELDECRLLDDDCEDMETDILEPAIVYAKSGVLLMILYLEHVDDPALADAEADLRQVYDDLLYSVETKVEFDAAVDTATDAWNNAASVIKLATIETLYEEVEALVETGQILDAKLGCGILELDASTDDLDSAYDSFAAQIQAADDHIDDAEDLLAADSLDEALEAIKDSQASLQSSQDYLETALNLLETQTGVLCDEVVIVDDDDENDKTDDATDQRSDEPDEGSDEDDDDESKDFDELLAESDLESYYYDARDAIESLVEYIEGMQGDGYDTSAADDVLAEAEGYFADAEDHIMAGESALSLLLNAETIAERGKSSEYYKKSSTTSSSNPDYNAFVSCMESTAYSYQRDACYEDYGISDDTSTEIEDCLDSGETEEECYEYADDEAEEQQDEEEEVLIQQLDGIENDLDDLETSVEDLFNELADTGIDQDDEDYDETYDKISVLLDDVQSQLSDYEQEIDDIETIIENEDYDDAENDIDDLEGEVDEFIADIEDQINDIQLEIAALS